jgi:ribosomal protein S18 acetylase RimI-like enzyme
MRTWRLRPADPADQAAIAAVAMASGLGSQESGADPDYLGHLLDHGTVRVAEDSGEVLGYAAAIRVGPATMLTDLFISPAAQGRGAGAALLAATMRGATWPMTFSSTDGRAIGLYTRLGMTGRWALLYLRGDPAGVTGTDPHTGGRPVDGPHSVGGARAEIADPARAAALEYGWTGNNRAAQYAYWVARPDGAAYLVRDDSGPMAVGCVGGAGASYGLTHLGLAPGAPAATALLALLSRLSRPGVVCLPSTHPAVAHLLRHGFVIDDFDLFMTGGPDLPGGPDGAYAPGLC